MIDRDHVILAYELILGREPESESVIEMICALDSLEDLSKMLHGSEEFRRRTTTGQLSSSEQRWVLAEIRDGLKLWIDLMDLGVGAGALRDNWEPEETNFILSHLDTGGCFLDVGANIGWYTILAADKVGPNGRVHAFEPRRDLFRRLADSVAVNGFQDRCTLHNLALGDAGGVLPLAAVPSEANPGHSFLAQRNLDPEAVVLESVPVRRLDDIEIPQRVDLLKIDVEGAEFMVLDGAREMLIRDRPYIISEFFPDWIRKVSGVDPAHYLGLIRSAGYRIFEVANDGIGNIVEDQPEGFERPGFYTNIVALPDGKEFRRIEPASSGRAGQDRLRERDASSADYSSAGMESRRAEESVRILVERFEAGVGELISATNAIEGRLSRIEDRISGGAGSQEMLRQGLAEIVSKAEVSVLGRVASTEEITKSVGQALQKQLDALSQKLDAAPASIASETALALKSKKTLLQKIVREIKRPFTRKFHRKLKQKYLRRSEPRVDQALSISECDTTDDYLDLRSSAPCLAGAERPVAMILDDRWPEPDRDSGSLDAVNMIAGLLEMGYHVIFGVETRRPQDPKYLEALRRMGAHPMTEADAPSIQAFIERWGKNVDLYLLSRVGAGGVYLELIRHNCPDARIIFNTVDLHYIREARAARLSGDAAALEAAERTRDREEFLVGRSDLTLVVSSVEEEILQASLPGCRTLVLPLARAIHPPRAGFAERSGIGFIGGFEHQPNIDAIRHFLTDVWPLVHAADPAIRCEIVGSALPPEVLDGVPGAVRYLGTLDSIDGWLESLRMTVAPLRIGAGAKGKVASSLCAGLPCVLSAVAAEGMDLEDGRDVLIGADPADMAAKIVRLHGDAAEWVRLSAGSLAFARDRLSVENYKNSLRRGILGLELPVDALPVLSHQ